MAPASERQQEVHRQRPVAQPSGRGNLPPQIGRSQKSDRPETAGSGDGRGEPMSRQTAAHAALNHRHPDPEPLQEGAHQLSAPAERSRQPPHAIAGRG